jgi:hypothetical protein
VPPPPVDGGTVG